MLKLALIALSGSSIAFTAVLTASIVVNRPIAEVCYQPRTPQDTSDRNFIPKRDLKRYCKRGRNCSWNRDNSLPGTVLPNLAPLRRAWCCFRLRLRLRGG
jgi:hypothetical protein